MFFYTLFLTHKVEVIFNGACQSVCQLCTKLIFAFLSNTALRITLSDKNLSYKIVEISAWCRKFCPTKTFVRRKFCPMFQDKSQAKIGQKCRNFGLVSKILSDEIFCPSKILSDELLSDKVLQAN